MTYVWVMVVAMFTPDGLVVQQSQSYESMSDCFMAREYVVQELGKPIVNYQAVCIQTNQYFEEAEDGPLEN